MVDNTYRYNGSYLIYYNFGYSSTLENNTVLQQAQKSLDANQKQLLTVSPEPVPNVVPSAVQKIQGTSMVEGVFSEINGSKQKVNLTAMLDDDITQASWNRLLMPLWPTTKKTP